MQPAGPRRTSYDSRTTERPSQQPRGFLLEVSGKRYLWEQVRPFVRAALAEDPALRSLLQMNRPPKLADVAKAQRSLLAIFRAMTPLRS